MLRRLAVFRGSFDVEQGAEVAAVPEVGRRTHARVIAAERASRSRSSCRSGRRRACACSRRSARSPRARLREAGEESAVRERHAASRTARSPSAAPAAIRAPRARRGSSAWRPSTTTSRAALGWHVELGPRGRCAAARRCAVVAVVLPRAPRGGLRGVASALAIGDESSRARLRALRAGSHLSWWRGDYGQASAYNADLARVRDAIDDDWGRAWAPMAFGAIALLSDPARALELLEESRARFEALGARVGGGLRAAGARRRALVRRRLERARRGFNEAVEIFDDSARFGAGLGHAQRRAHGRALRRPRPRHRAL